MKGQFLFENGRIAESITMYEKALQLLPETALLQLSLAHALLESSEEKNTASRAIGLLQKAQIKQPTPLGWQLLARAYDIAGNRAASLYAAAEFSYSIGNLYAAEKQLQQAEKLSKDNAIKLKIKDLQERVKEEIAENEAVY